jgi:predicted site-specific integrase-resolvase
MTLMAAARLLGVGYYRAWRHIADGKVRSAELVSGRWVLDVEDLRQAIAATAKRRPSPSASAGAVT